MVVDQIGLESAVLRLLSRANRPLKARAIAALLSSERPTSIHKREINPTLYRMLSNGRLCRDSRFRWYLNEKNYPSGSVSNESLSSGVTTGFDSSATFVNPAPIVESPSSPDQYQKDPTEELSYGETTEVADDYRPVETALPHARNYGRFQIVEEIRSYVRHCTWCSREIPERKAALVVRGVYNRCPRFCSEDCFQNWESIYWQKVALSHLGLSREELKLEERYLRRQKYFARLT